MNTKTFYGLRRAIIPVTDISDDENSSDGDENDLKIRQDVLCYESESDTDFSETGEVIDKTDDTDDDVPLVSRLESARARYIKKASQNQKEYESSTPSTSFGRNNGGKKSEKEKIKWEEKKLPFLEDGIKFKGSESLPNNIQDLDGIIQFFNFLFRDEIVTYITEQSNLFGVQCRPEKPPNITKEEIKVFVGICIYMSIVQLPATRNYWNSSLDIPSVSNAMSCNRFEQIRRFLHFNDNMNQPRLGEPEYDKLYKIRPLLNKIRERLLLVPKEEHMAVDEQIIPTKSRSSLKQYNPKKPHKWGYKVFVLSGVSGFSYDFDFYSGPTELEDGLPNLGASSNVVVKLSSTIPKNQNYKLFFDNWFTSVPLLVYLSKQGILPLGTVRSNRVPNFQFPKEAEMKKKGRGAVTEKVANIDGVDISVVSWYDNKIVNTISTYVGSQPMSDVKRFCRKTKCHIEIPRPKCIGIYNNYMGGVDLLDSMLGYYRIQIRSKKWYMRVFYHFIDMLCVNSWILWRRSQTDDMYLPLAEFKLALAEILTRANVLQKKRGRPSNDLQTQLQLKKKKYPFAQIPAQEIRTDNLGHLPEWSPTERQRCKYIDCKGKSHIYCAKCMVFLCLNKDRNCFYRFHTE